MKKMRTVLRFPRGSMAQILLKMKLLTVLMLAVVAVSAANNTYSQATKFNLKLNNVPVKQVFLEIEENSEFILLYNEKDVDVNRKVDIKVQDETVEFILNRIFADTQNEYKIYDRQIVILKDKNAPIPSILKEKATKSKTQQSEKEISGKVTDVNGEPLPGVSVIVKGTTIGTVTNAGGEFSLTIPLNAEVLQFSFVGMKTKDLPVEEKTNYTVVLEEDVLGIEEVVAVGYGTLKRMEITGSVATIDNEELTSMPVANTTELLTGRLSGVITQQTSGLPGSDNTEISIRGFGNPLVIVDGIQMDFSRIDPNDIESVSVLKDAAAAVYGARAGNGVILVNTKRGKTDKPTIQYHGTYTTQEAMAFLQRVNAGDWAMLFREAQLNLGLPPELSEEEVQKYINGEPGYESYDWTGELIKNFAPMQQHNISVNGGNERVKYYASTGYMGQESVFRSRDFDYTRYNTRTNLDLVISDKLNFSVDLSYQKDLIDRATENEGAIWTSLSTAQPRYPTWLPDRMVGSYSGFQGRNPLVQTMKDFSGFYTIHTETFNGKIEGNYLLPVSGLQFNIGTNVMALNTHTRQFETPYDLYIYVPDTEEYIWQAGGTTIDLRESYDRASQVYPYSSFTYEQDFGNHSVKGLLLGEYIEEDSIYFNAYRRDLLSKEIPYLFAGGDQNMDNDGGASESGRASVVGRLNYNFKEKYFLETTFRYDANVQFAPDNRWGFFPSISAAWRISEEPFFGKDNFVDDLKIRASFTQLGNDRFAVGWDYLTGFEIFESRGHLIGNEIGRQIRTLGLANPLLTWEDMTIYNLGLNTALFGARLLMEADVFYRKREGILAMEVKNYPSTFGAEMPLVNINSQDTRGIEGMLLFQDRMGSFTYSVSPNITYARSKWIHFEEVEYTDPDDIRIYRKSGNWVNREIGYVSDGIFMSQAEIDEHPVDQDQNENTTLIPGDIKYVDLNDDKVIDYRDQKEIGYGTFPNMTYGLALNASYKSFRLDALFQGASMFNSVINGGVRGMFSNGTIPFDFQKKYRWQPDPNEPALNVNPNAELPAASIDIRPNNNLYSDFWLKDATYIRLKNLSLSYNLPETTVRRAGFGMVQIYLSGTNLLTLSKLGIYKNSFDPEQPGRIRNYPLHRRYSIGLRLTI